MLKAKDIMQTKVITIEPQETIIQAAKLMLGNQINGLPVVNKENKVIGIITQSDLILTQKKVDLPSFFTLLDGFLPLSSLNKLEEEIKKMSAVRVKEAMTPNPLCLSPEHTLEEIAQIMAEKKYHTLPVVDEEQKLIGIIGKADILKALVNESSS
ncbi:MAG: hypothetical protein PWR24_161 [Desulfonauticus sp.]|jgi:CBS domain-containing protein|nr:MAG: CBS domain containing membrane protein [Desulfonauticus sp. 38_4375]MDK2920604.1 hypothetical protein [Desulfonauticus sp.]